MSGQPPPSVPPPSDDGMAPPVPHPQQPYPQQGYPQPQSTNALAIVSLVTSILWMCGLGSLAAAITGHMARKQIQDSNGAQSGDGLAVAGLVIGYIGLALIALYLLAIFVLIIFAREEGPKFSEVIPQVR